MEPSGLNGDPKVICSVSSAEPNVMSLSRSGYVAILWQWISWAVFREPWEPCRFINLVGRSRFDWLMPVCDTLWPTCGNSWGDASTLSCFRRPSRSMASYSILSFGINSYEDYFCAIGLTFLLKCTFYVELLTGPFKTLCAISSWFEFIDAGYWACLGSYLAYFFSYDFKDGSFGLPWLRPDSGLPSLVGPSKMNLSIYRAVNSFCYVFS